MTTKEQNTDTTLAPIDREGLQKLISAGKADPSIVRTVRCRTVALPWAFTQTQWPKG